MKTINEYWVYVLELKGGKYYVGISRDIEKRYEQHECGEGASFTHKYKPIRIVYKENTQSIYKKDAEHKENIITLQWMILKGIENVRGGDYCACDLDEIICLMDDRLYEELCDNELKEGMTSKQAKKLARRLYNNSSNKKDRDLKIEERENLKQLKGGTYCQVEMCWNNRNKKCQLGLSPWDKQRCSKNYKAR